MDIYMKFSISPNNLVSLYIRLLKRCSVALLLASLPLSANANTDVWPERPVTILVASRVGGSLDGMARGLAKYLKPILGVPVVVVNKPGGVTSVATEALVSQPADGYTYLVTTTTPYLIGSILNLDVSYDIASFVTLNDQWVSAEALHLHRKHEHADLLSLLDDIKSNPKKLSVGVFPKSGGHLGLLLTLNAVNIPAENLRIVYFDSGSQFRAALAGGHIDFAIMPLESTHVISGYVRTMAVFSSQRQLGFEKVNTVNEELATAGVRIQDVPLFSRGLISRAELKEAYPQRYAHFITAVQAVMNNKVFQAEMDKRLIGRRWVGPDLSTQHLHSSYNSFKKYSDMLSNYE